MASGTVALIPAHNEQDVIADAIRALLTQSTPPDRVVVVSDNSTDTTVEIAKSFGPMVEVYETEGNRYKKAGALNQALEALSVADEDFILVVDADTELSPDWLTAALSAFEQPDVGAVGGVFVGDKRNGLLGDLQGVEYARYQRQIRREYGKAKVLTGTSTMARMGTFRAVKRKREAGELPGAGYYNTEALTEDFEFTVCIKRLGLKTISPKQCTVITETMPSVPMLWRQRVRWQLGALDVLTMHGTGRVTAPYALRQVEAGLGIVANISILTMAITSALGGNFIWVPFWLALGLLFLYERITSGAEYGWKGTLIAATMVADIAFDLFISAVWIWCLVLKATTRKRGWGHASIDAVAKGA